jgi:hypothetical protein
VYLTFYEKILLNHLQEELEKGRLVSGEIIFNVECKDLVKKVAWDYGYIMAIAPGAAATPQGIYITVSFIKRFWPC